MGGGETAPVPGARLSPLERRRLFPSRTQPRWAAWGQHLPLPGPWSLLLRTEGLVPYSPLAPGYGGLFALLGASLRPAGTGEVLASGLDWDPSPSHMLPCGQRGWGEAHPWRRGPCLLWRSFDIAGATGLLGYLGSPERAVPCN